MVVEEGGGRERSSLYEHIVSGNIKQVKWLLETSVPRNKAVNALADFIIGQSKEDMERGGVCYEMASLLKNHYVPIQDAESYLSKKATDSKVKDFQTMVRVIESDPLTTVIRFTVGTLGIIIGCNLINKVVNR